MRLTIFIALVACGSTLGSFSPLDRETGGELEILVMRHGKSMYNKISMDYNLAHGLPITNEDLSVRTSQDPRAMDPVLSEEGVLQCQRQSEGMEKNHGNIKYVMMSPYRRAVMTAMISTESIREKNQIEYSIVPWFREIFSTVGELGVHSQEYLEENYPSVDVSALHDNPMWMFDYWDSSHDKELFRERLLARHNLRKSVFDMIPLIGKGDIGMENQKMMSYRSEKTREHIRKFIRDKREKEGVEVRDGEILLVGHKFSVAYMLGSDFNRGRFGFDSLDIKNAEIYPYRLLL